MQNPGFSTSSSTSAGFRQTRGATSTSKLQLTLFINVLLKIDRFYCTFPIKRRFFFLLKFDYHRVWLCFEHRNLSCSSRKKGKRNRGTLRCCLFTFGIILFWLHCIMNCQYANCLLFSMNDKNNTSFFPGSTFRCSGQSFFYNQ